MTTLWQCVAALFAALALVLLLAPDVPALEGERCRSTSSCSQYEICVADSLASTWGRCVRMKILP